LDLEHLLEVKVIFHILNFILDKATPYHVDYEGMRNIVDVCKSNNKSPQIILVSSIGVTRYSFRVEFLSIKTLEFWIYDNFNNYGWKDSLMEI
jgi:hypothetical protein